MEVFGHVIDVAKLLHENVGNIGRAGEVSKNPTTRTAKGEDRVFNHQGDQWCLWVRLEDWVGPRSGPLR